MLIFVKFIMAMNNVDILWVGENLLSLSTRYHSVCKMVNREMIQFEVIIVQNYFEMISSEAQRRKLRTAEVTLQWIYMENVSKENLN